MRTHFKFLSGVMLVLVSLLVVGAVIAPLTQTRDIKINSAQDAVHFTIQQIGTQSANAIEVRRGSTLEFAVPGTNVAAGLKSNLGIQSGTQIITTLSTSVTFSVAFTAAPIVVVQPTIGIRTNFWVATTTTTNFTFTGQDTVSNYVRWIAIGAP